MHWQFGEMEFGEMKRNTSNWSNFGMLLRRAVLTASAGLSCTLSLCTHGTQYSRAQEVAKEGTHRGHNVVQSKAAIVETDQ